MIYLLDTNVISELRKAPVDHPSARPTKAKADRNVLAWAKSIPSESMYLSSITLLELELGVLLMERRDAAQGAIFRTWITRQVIPAFAGRILPVDSALAQRCAALHVPNPHPFRDSLIAATGLLHSMTVVTRNVEDFTSTGVAILNPWNFSSATNSQ
jgi:hypothetical protein